MSYSDNKIQFIKSLKKAKPEITWKEISDEYNKQYGDNKTGNALRKAFRRYRDVDFSETHFIDNLRRERSARKNASRVARENRAILDFVDEKEELIDAIKELIKDTKFTKLNIPKIKFNKNKPNMVIEPLFSDIHVGRKSKAVNLEIITKRVDDYCSEILKQIQIHEKTYNITKIIIPFLGDNIENDLMHDRESVKSSEFTNAEQIVFAIRIFFHNLLIRIAATGYPIEVKGLPGNHDRDTQKKSVQDPGKSYFSKVIYEILADFCALAKIKNITFDIADNVFLYADVFGETILYEHLDMIGKGEKSLNDRMNDRSRLYGKIIEYIRGGHFHVGTIMCNGRMIINGNIAGQDSYGEANSYESKATQLINFYIEPKSKNKTSYSHTIFVDFE